MEQKKVDDGIDDESEDSLILNVIAFETVFRRFLLLIFYLVDKHIDATVINYYR